MIVGQGPIALAVDAGGVVWTFFTHLSFLFSFSLGGWSGGAKVLGNLPVPGRPTNLDYHRARACCACSRCRWGLFGHFFSLIYPFSPLYPCLWETARYRLTYCLKGPLNPKQPTNQPFLIFLFPLLFFLSAFFLLAPTFFLPVPTARL